MTSCESCKKIVTEVINWLNARDEERAMVIAAVATSHAAHKPLVMYSDELEAARPATNFNPDATVEKAVARYEAVQRLREDLQSRITPSATTPPSPYFDPEVAAMPPGERVQYLSKRYCATICIVRMVDVPKKVLDLVKVEMCRRYCCLPLYLTEDKQLVICVADPSNLFVKEQIYFSTGHEVGVCGVGVEIAPAENIMAAIDRLYGPAEAVTVQTIG
ncbi:MAG: hypothetical protein AAB666_00965 [Patescibacteria group bacterium]